MPQNIDNGGNVMKKFKIGLQLFSVRDEMDKDFEGTLKKVSEMGYEYVEFAGYYGKTAEEIKEILDKYNLKAISVHQNYEFFIGEDAQKNVDFLKTIGAEYAAIPWMGLEKHKGTDLYEQTVNDIKKVADLLSKNGIQLLYHNHEFEFKKYEDKFYLEWLLEDTQGKMLPELDTCWVHYAGNIPQEYMLKYKGKLPVVHLKDFECKQFMAGPVYGLIDESGKEMKNNTREDNGFEFRPVGDGKQDVAAILKAAEECGSEYIIVEQDGFTGIEPMDAVKKSRDYLKSLGQ